MRVDYEAVYRLELTAPELHVLLIALHGGPVAAADQPVLQHLRQGLLHGIAGTLRAEQLRFFTAGPATAPVAEGMGDPADTAASPTHVPKAP